LSDARTREKQAKRSTSNSDHSELLSMPTLASHDHVQKALSKSALEESSLAGSAAEKTFHRRSIRLRGVFDAVVDGRDPMQSILDRKLLLLQLLNHHGIGVRSLHQSSDFRIQMPMVTLQALHFQMLHVSCSRKGG
jgi:hypothetical protein